MCHRLAPHGTSKNLLFVVDLEQRPGLHFFLYFLAMCLEVVFSLPVLFPLGAMTSIFSNLF